MKPKKKQKSYPGIATLETKDPDKKLMVYMIAWKAGLENKLFSLPGIKP